MRVHIQYCEGLWLWHLHCSYLIKPIMVMLPLIVCATDLFCEYYSFGSWCTLTTDAHWLKLDLNFNTFTEWNIWNIYKNLSRWRNANSFVSEYQIEQYYKWTYCCETYEIHKDHSSGKEHPLKYSNSYYAMAL